MNTNSLKVFVRAGLIALIVVLTGAALSTDALAQQAQVSGSVTDSSGALVPGAAIQITSPDTGFTRKTSSNEKGYYVLSLIPPGHYQLTAQKEGFKLLDRSGINLDVGQAAQIDFTLELGSLTQRVNVTAQTPLLQTTTSEVYAEMDPVQMTELPLNGRNPVELAGLLPGVSNVIAPQFSLDTNGGPQMTVSGSRGGSNMMMFDGASYTGDFLNVSGMFPPPDWLLEFKVSTNLFSAEYGSNSGAVVNAVTRSGTNDFHGNFYEFLRNSALNARDYFLPEKSSLIQNQFGFSTGGPVLRNKLFYFGGLEYLRIRPAATSITAYPPTTAERSGDFSAIKTPIIDPLTNAPFPGNQIPQARFDPVAVNVLQFVPPPNQANGSYFSSAKGPTNMYSGTVRGDYQASNRLSFYDRLFRDYASQFSPIAPSNMPFTPNTQGSGAWNNVFSWTTVLSPNTINQFRDSVYFTTDVWTETNVKTLPELGAIWAPEFGTPLPPWFDVSGSFNLGGVYAKNVSHHQYEVYDDVSMQRGQHTIKFGGRFHRNNAVTGTYGPKDGSFTFDGSITGNPIADFMLGKTANLGITSAGWFTDFVDNAYDFYGQDDWRVSPALTLNLGVHYQVQLPWTEGNNEWGTVYMNSGFQSTRFPGAPVDSAYVGDPGVPKGLIKTNWHQIQPRFGFAYKPQILGGKTVLRGGFGVFGEQMDGQVIQNTQQPFQLNYTFNDVQLQNPLQGTGVTSLEPSVSNPVFVAPFSSEYPSRNFTPGYVFGYNLFIQHELSNNLSLEAGYVGKIGRKLFWVYPTNPAIYVPGNSTLDNIQSRRIYRPSLYGDLEEINTNANSSYNALQVRVIRRLAAGFSIQGAYTLSKSLDEESSVSVNPNIVNPFNLRSNYGLSDFDQRQIANATIVDQLPNLGTSGFERALLHNWEVSGILTISTGLPISITSGRDIALSGTGGQTPNLVGNPVLSHSSKNDAILQWFNTSAFAYPATGSFGNVGRNTVEGPGAWNITTGVYRNFPITERYRLQFRSEFFNLFNHTNLANPDGALSDGTFGQVLSDNGGPRVIQFALKLFY